MPRLVVPLYAPTSVRRNIMLYSVLLHRMLGRFNVRGLAVGVALRPSQTFLLRVNTRSTPPRNHSVTYPTSPLVKAGRILDPKSFCTVCGSMLQRRLLRSCLSYRIPPWYFQCR